MKEEFWEWSVAISNMSLFFFLKKKATLLPHCRFLPVAVNQTYLEFLISVLYFSGKWMINNDANILSICDDQHWKRISHLASINTCYTGTIPSTYVYHRFCVEDWELKGMNSP